nr:MAG TPA: hypothetical protein [Bacteriophage sp.]
MAEKSSLFLFLATILGLPCVVRLGLGWGLALSRDAGCTRGRPHGRYPADYAHLAPQELHGPALVIGAVVSCPTLVACRSLGSGSARLFGLGGVLVCAMCGSCWCRCGWCSWKKCSITHTLFVFVGLCSFLV